MKVESEAAIARRRVGATRRLSLPGLTRQSINLPEKLLRRRWITGSSPVRTIPLGMTAIVGAPSPLTQRSGAPCLLVVLLLAADRLQLGEHRIDI
jgi:hypothetical protein